MAKKNQQFYYFYILKSWFDVKTEPLKMSKLISRKICAHSILGHPNANNDSVADALGKRSVWESLYSSSSTELL